MRLACVSVPRFGLAVEARLDLWLLHASAIVYDRNRVLEASPELTDVHAGQPLRQARAAYPHAVFVAAQPLLYREVAEAMLHALEQVGPQVELAEDGCAFVDVGGLDGHDADAFALAGQIVDVVRDATGLLPSVGMAEGKFVARVAAALCPPGDAGVVPTGRERGFLCDKSVSLLPCAPEIIEHLHTLALHTLGDIAGLPKTAVEAQFGGGAGRRMWELAHGIDREPLRPHRSEESLSERLTFEAPVAAHEAVTLAGRQLLKRLAGRLDRRAARTMHVQVLAGERLLWERSEAFREPTADEGRMAFILKTRLSALRLTEGVDTLVITLSGIGREAARQPKLITEGNPRIESLADAIRQVRARYGRPMVWRAVEVDPCSRHPEERAVLIPYDA